MKKVFNPILLLLLTIFLVMSLSLLLDEPLIWPDEAIYGDISRNLMLENRMGTDLWKGFIDGIENRAYSLPPLYLYTSSIWYREFGFSIITQRLFSVFLGSVFLTLFYLVSQKFILSGKKPIKNLLPIGVTLLLAIDTVFLRASRLGRPEILVLLLVMFSLLFYLRSIEEKIVKTGQKYLFLTGLFLGFSIITHLIAIGFTLAITCALIYSQRNNLLNFTKYNFFVLGILIPIIAWLIYLYPNYQYLIDQLKLVEASRHYTIPWYINVLSFPLLNKLTYLFYLLISLFFVIFTLKNRKQPYILLSLVLIFAWGFTTLGQIYWYTVYPVSLSYLALLILISKAFFRINRNLNLSSKNFLKNLTALILLLLSLFFLYTHLSNYSGLINSFRNNAAYQTFQNQITEAVPPGKTVYLSSIPDAYYAFKAGRNRLIEFPALFSDIEKFKRVLLEIDYIVFNGMYIPDPEASVYLDKYIARNLESTQELSQPYHILIIKLKDKNLRQQVN